MSTLTEDERWYDIEMTFFRGMREDAVLELGIIVGILSDYLEGNPQWDYCSEDGDLFDLYLRGVAEGTRYQRFEYTAEELFVWAHKFDKVHL